MDRKKFSKLVRLIPSAGLNHKPFVSVFREDPGSNFYVGNRLRDDAEFQTDTHTFFSS